MSVPRIIPSNRTLLAATLAQHAATALPVDAHLRKLFASPTEALNLIGATGDGPASTMVHWSQSPFLGGEQGLQNFDCLRLVWGDSHMAAVAIVACTAPAYAPNVCLEEYSRRNLLTHQLVTGWTAEIIARHCDLDTTTAFLCGALHDVGLLALERMARSRFTRVLQTLDPLTPTISIERQQYGCDHAAIGAELLRLWGASERICDAVQWHHQPLGAEAVESQQLAGVVALSNFLVSRLGKSSLGVHNLQPPPDDVFAGLKIGYRALSEVVDELVRWMPKSERFIAA